ncbi:MAG: TIGR02757 family protein [Bacteroidetes bacterium GWF2_33_16]|nr:MAG: TIGR02757 family protein [Bacteroidetes bacterium GWE2_32_14]OFY05545.1 MAG: TIGR02757 family protein [Bacteroidetes bacterium GWF2_33_16]
MNIGIGDLKEFLDEKYEKYNHSDFIDSDPIKIPHSFSDPYDIEISAFLAATIAWGQRATIIKNSYKLIALMDNSPYDFLINCNKTELKRFEYFIHRTFNGIDCMFFIKSLQNIYKKHGGLGVLFQRSYLQNHNVKETLVEVRKTFFEIDHQHRTEKHFSDVSKGSSAKRLNMFLRWFVRNDNRGVDFGLWSKIPASALYLPLDIHTGNVARKLGLLTRNQNDWLAVEQVTSNLRKFDANDPVKYDFALFSLGLFEKF